MVVTQQHMLRQKLSSLASLIYTSERILAKIRVLPFRHARWDDGTTAYNVFHIRYILFCSKTKHGALFNVVVVCMFVNPWLKQLFQFEICCMVFKSPLHVECIVKYCFVPARTELRMKQGKFNSVNRTRGSRVPKIALRRRH